MQKPYVFASVRHNSSVHPHLEHPSSIGLLPSIAPSGLGRVTLLTGLSRFKLR